MTPAKRIEKRLKKPENRQNLIIDIGSWVRAPESIYDVDDSVLDKAFVEKCDRKIVCFVHKAIQ